MPDQGSCKATSQSGFKAILFDMDGVILDSEPVHQQALQVAMKAYDVSIPPWASELFRGLTEEKVCRMVVDRWSNGQVDWQTLMNAKYTAYANLAHKVQVIPGIMELIEYVHELPWPLGLVTSAAKHDQLRAFDLFGLGKYFPVVVTAADIQHPKPHPQPYQFAASRMQVEPADCLVIEDSKYGVKSAAQAGCIVYGFLSHFSRDDLLEAGAQETFQSAKEIKQHLSTLV